MYQDKKSRTCFIKCIIIHIKKTSGTRSFEYVTKSIPSWKFSLNEKRVLECKRIKNNCREYRNLIWFFGVIIFWKCTVSARFWAIHEMMVSYTANLNISYIVTLISMSKTPWQKAVCYLVRSCLTYELLSPITINSKAWYPLDN